MWVRNTTCQIRLQTSNFIPIAAMSTFTDMSTARDPITFRKGILATTLALSRASQHDPDGCSAAGSQAHCGGRPRLVPSRWFPAPRAHSSDLRTSLGPPPPPPAAPRSARGSASPAAHWS